MDLALNNQPTFFGFNLALSFADLGPGIWTGSEKEKLQTDSTEKLSLFWRTISISTRRKVQI